MKIYFGSSLPPISGRNERALRQTLREAIMLLDNPEFIDKDVFALRKGENPLTEAVVPMSSDIGATEFLGIRGKVNGAKTVTIAREDYQAPSPDKQAGTMAHSVFQLLSGAKGYDTGRKLELSVRGAKAHIFSLPVHSNGDADFISVETSSTKKPEMIALGELTDKTRALIDTLGQKMEAYRKSRKDKPRRQKHISLIFEGMMQKVLAQGNHLKRIKSPSLPDTEIVAIAPSVQSIVTGKTFLVTRRPSRTLKGATSWEIRDGRRRFLFQETDVAQGHYKKGAFPVYYSRRPKEHVRHTPYVVVTGTQVERLKKIIAPNKA